MSTATPYEAFLAFTRRRWVRVVFGVLVAILLIVLPFILGKFGSQTVTHIIVFAVAVLGLNVIMGYTGQVSLGQIFFVGLGAYCAAITVKSDWGEALGVGGVLVALVLSIVIPGVIGFLVSLAAARLRGLAIAMVTIALPIIGVPLSKRFSDLTGGSEGMSARVFDAPEWTGLYKHEWQYFIVLVIAAAVFALAYFLVRGKFGRAFAIVKANEAVASSMGISPYRYKVLAFTIASMFGGIAGFLYIVSYEYTNPDTMAFPHSIELVIATIVGGSGSIIGSIIGGAFYILVPSITQGLQLSNLTTVIQGIVILVVLFLLPGGLASIPRVIRRLVRRRHGGQDVDAGDAAGSAP